MSQNKNKAKKCINPKETRLKTYSTRKKKLTHAIKKTQKNSYIDINA